MGQSQTKISNFLKDNINLKNLMYGVYVCLTYVGQKSKPLHKKHGIKSEDIRNMDSNTLIVSST
jgi:hypothetical protein